MSKQKTLVLRFQHPHLPPWTVTSPECRASLSQNCPDSWGHGDPVWSRMMREGEQEQLHHNACRSRDSRCTAAADHLSSAAPELPVSSPPKTEWRSQRPATVAALEHTRTLQEWSLWKCFGEIYWSQKYNGVLRVTVELSQRLNSTGVNNVQLGIAFLWHIFF